MKTLVILAGGNSTRMGKDKVFLHISNGRTFIEHLYRNAEPFFERIIVSAGSVEHSQKIRELLPEAEIVVDHYLDIGPGGGLLSVFEETQVSSFAVIPVDVPFARMEVLSFFYDRCGDRICFFQNEQGRKEPLIAAYGPEVLLELKKNLMEGNRRMMSLFSDDSPFYTSTELKAEIPEISDCDLESAFRNINTMQEYREFTA